LRCRNKRDTEADVCWASTERKRNRPQENRRRMVEGLSEDKGKCADSMRQEFLSTIRDLYRGTSILSRSLEEVEEKLGTEGEPRGSASVIQKGTILISFRTGLSAFRKLISLKGGGGNDRKKRGYSIKALRDATMAGGEGLAK